MSPQELHELNTPQVAGVLGLTEQSIRNHVHAGRLTARRHGVRRYYRVRVADLRAFADRYNYPLDETLLACFVAETSTHAPARA
ncbi:MAG: helix-turn-helix domain-containing protein [Caldilineaceae bacterium]|nr:helix-turn-helix domain-containing protein [Caldilineaceae bacterium]